jgi:hypothetical protein
MADQSQLDVLLRGVGPWNKWRERNPRRKVDLSGVNLHSSRTNLIRANLSRADLSGADLSKADLSAVLPADSITQEQIEQATGNEQTELPEHLNPPASWSQRSHDQQTGDK